MKEKSRLSSCFRFLSLGLSLWILACPAAEKKRCEENTPAIVAVVLASVMISTPYNQDKCQIWVLSGDFDDLVHKAALHPSCTLRVSGTYKMRYAINLYDNQILGASDPGFIRPLPTAADTDLTPDGISGISHEKPQQISAGALFVPAEGFSDTYYFKLQGSASFEHIGFQKPLLVAQDFTLISERANDETVPEFIQIGLIQPQKVPDSEPFLEIQQWGKEKPQKSYSQPRQNQQQEHYSRDKANKRPSSPGSSKKTGQDIAGGDKPPRKPSRWDQQVPDALDEFTVTMVLHLISEILAGQNVQKNIVTIRNILKKASSKTCRKLLDNPDFNRLNQAHAFIVTYPNPNIL